LENLATTPVLLRFVLEDGLDAAMPFVLMDCGSFWWFFKPARGMVEGVMRGGTAKEKK
jgi:hypothetical protein